MIRNAIALTPAIKRTIIRWLIDGEINLNEAEDILHGEEARQRRATDARIVMHVMYDDDPKKWREKAANLNALADGAMTIDEYIQWADAAGMFF